MCFINQYNQYNEILDDKRELRVNGKLTINENIADSMGLQIAYDAWLLNSADIEGVNFNLPGLDVYSSEQLFFISTGMMWCSNSRNDALAKQYKTDVHTPNRFRVIGAMSNSEQFAKAFKCRTTDRMNMDKKCKLF